MAPARHFLCHNKFLLCVRYILWHGAEEFHYHWQCDGCGNRICDCLGHLDAEKSHGLAENPQDRDEDQSASDHGEKRRFSTLSDTLEHHISAQGEWHAEQGKALNPQGSDADGDDCRVIPEHTHDGSRKHDSDQGGNAHDNETAADAEPEGFPHAAVFFRAVVEGADRLETLANAEGNTEQEHDDSCYNAHGRNGGIAVKGRALV